MAWAVPASTDPHAVGTAPGKAVLWSTATSDRTSSVDSKGARSDA